uniref:Uncharacterized protein n=1 Tax=Oryza sativa subsp. japonica TaxID=39947 RepID=Q654L2_ORYSJ|nr:hypothetical protein [Oryza sativa Japonica Group]
MLPIHPQGQASAPDVELKGITIVSLPLSVCIWVLMSKEDTPYSRNDHSKGTIVRRKYVRKTVT